ncbi:hypothetical protein DFH06DRAFT_123234 [Mycena polygramma]|nr:hypothetical protein DFH06DRAFT_123234 [Mycena polygramma]
MLWRTIVVNTALWNRSDRNPMTLLGLLLVSLDRGGSHPLTVRVAVEKAAWYGTQVLELLSRHSRRWRVAHFRSGSLAFQSIASARGNLPFLQKLDISQNDCWDEIDVFQVAPRLTSFSMAAMTGRGTRVPSIPWTQIQMLSYESYQPDVLAQGLSLLRDDFASGSRCDLTMGDFKDVGSTALPSIVSNVAALNLTLSVSIFREQLVGVLGVILASLTLPCLNTLSLIGKGGTHLPISWPQQVPRLRIPLITARQPHHRRAASHDN